MYLLFLIYRTALFMKYAAPVSSNTVHACNSKDSIVYVFPFSQVKFVNVLVVHRFSFDVDHLLIVLPKQGGSRLVHYQWFLLISKIHNFQNLHKYL